MSELPTLADALRVSSEFGKGGANLTEGSPQLGQILRAWDALVRGWITSDEEGKGLDSIGVIHSRDFVDHFDPETVHSAMDALIVTKQRAEQAYEIGFGAASKGIKRAAGFIFAEQLAGQPITDFVYEFDGGALLPSGAVFHSAVFHLLQKFDDAGHSSIKVSLGLHTPPGSPSEDDRTALAALIEVGTTTTIEGKFSPASAPGPFAFAGCPIENKNVILRIKSDANLDQITQGVVAVDLLYFTP